MNRHYRQKRVRDSRRTIPVSGLGEDSNRYYRCHHCGFINDVERDPSFEGMGAKAGNYRVIGDVTSTPYDNDATLTLGNGIVLAEEDAAGDMKPPYITYEVSPSGCPLCGTRSNRT